MKICTEVRPHTRRNSVSDPAVKQINTPVNQNDLFDCFCTRVCLVIYCLMFIERVFLPIYYKSLHTTLSTVDSYGRKTNKINTFVPKIKVETTNQSDSVFMKNILINEQK